MQWNIPTNEQYTTEWTNKFTWRKTCRIHIHDLIWSVYVIHTSYIMVFYRWIPSYQRYYLPTCQPFRRVTQVPGSGFQKISSQKHRWIPLFHSNKKPGCFFFLVRRYIVRNSIWNNKKNMQGILGEGANTSFREAAFFFVREFGSPFPLCHGDIFEMTALAPGLDGISYKILYSSM